MREDRCSCAFGADENSIKATAETERDARQASSSATTKRDPFGNSTSEWRIVEWKLITTSSKFIISGRHDDQCGS